MTNIEERIMEILKTTYVDLENKVCKKCGFKFIEDSFSGVEGKMIRHHLFEHEIPEYAEQLINIHISKNL